MILTYLCCEDSQGHQTWYESLDLKQGYNHAKFERHPKTASTKKFLSNQKTCQLPPLNMCKSEN